MAQQTAMQSLLTHLEMLKSKVEMVDVQSVIDTINTSYLELEKEMIQKAFSDGQETPINHPTLPHYSNEEYYNETFEK
jgi:hypothetical protein